MRRHEGQFGPPSIMLVLRSAQRRGSAAAIASAICWLALFADRAAGQEPAPAQRAEESYRRIFVPAEELMSQIKGLLPVRREEVDRRMAAANSGAATAPHAAQIVLAEYSARLAGEELVQGQARWNIDHRAKEPTLLALAPCNLALGNATWQTEPPRNAALGAGPDGALHLLVEQSGAVQATWSRRGQRHEDGQLEFHLKWPLALVSRLIVRTEAAVRLEAEPGLVTQLGHAPDAADQLQWLIEPGAASGVALRVLRGTSGRRAKGLVLVKEETTFSLTPADYSAEFRLSADVYHSTLQSAVLRIDPQLAVTAVRLAGTPVAWSLSDQPERTLNVEFPQGLSGTGHELVVQAAGELPPDRPWRLPRVTWLGSHWLEGTAQVRVPPSICATVRTQSECRQIASAGARAGGQLGFVYHGLAGFVELEAARLEPLVMAGSGITAVFDASQLSATLRSDLTVTDGEKYELDVTVSNHWILDSLESVPPDMLDDRPVIAQDDRQRTLRLRLARPLTPRRPLRLVVRAHREMAQQSALSSQELTGWFRFVRVVDSPTLLSLRSNIPNAELEVSGDQSARRLDPEAASAQELARIDAPLTGLLYELEASDAPFDVAVRPGQPKYAAACETTAECDRSLVRQRVAIRCTPAGPGISRLTVRSSPPPGREIRWRVSGAPEAAIAAQTRRDLASAAGRPAAEAVWELELSRPVAQPFVLESDWEGTRQPRHALSLFACDEATTQEGIVRVEVADDTRLAAEWQQLAAIPIASPGSDRFSRTRGLFGYDPGQRASLTLTEALPESALPAAWVRSAALQTRFAANGSALHALTLELENAGLSQFRFGLPSAAYLMGVAVDDAEAAPLAGVGEAGQWRVALPAGKRRTQVRITYAAPSQPLVWQAGAWRAVLPTIELPVAGVWWSAALPPGFARLESKGPAGLHEELWQRFWGIGIGESAATLTWLRPWVDRAALARGPLEAPGSQSPPAAEAELPALDPGWTVAESFAAWDAPVTIYVYRPQLVRLWGLALAIAAGYLAAGWAPRWPAAAAAAIVLLAAATIVVPLSAAPLAAGALWGTVAGWFTTLLRPRAGQQAADRPSRHSTVPWLAGAATSAVLLAVGMLGIGRLLHAAPPEGEQESPKPRMVIPVDENRQPTGDYVYVDGMLYDRLFRRAEQGPASVPWSIRSARYEVRWPRATDQSPVAELRAMFDMDISAAEAAVLLPLRREQVVIQQGGVRRDGATQSVAWRDSGQGLVLPPAFPGRSQVELWLSVPVRRNADGGGQLRLAIPRAPIADVAIVAEGSHLRFEIPTALGAASAEGAAEPTRHQQALGPADELVIRAFDAQEQDALPAAAEAELLSWWRVRPGSVSLDAVCKFRPLAGSLRRVALRYDPRLVLLPLEDQPRIERTWVEAGSMPTLHVALTEPTSEPVAVKLRFLLTEPFDAGPLALPRLEPLAGRAARHWIGVTAGPGLELSPAHEPPAPPAAPAEFAQQFGGSDPGPQLAYDLAQATDPLELVFRSESTQPVAEANTILVLNRRGFRLEFQGVIDSPSPHQLQHRLTLPAGWIAERLVVSEGGAALPVRWHQQPGGEVIIHLERPGSQRQLVELSASRRADGSAGLTLPAVAWSDVRLNRQSLRVYRGHDLHAAVTSHEGWSRDEAVLTRHEEPHGRLVASFHAAGPQPPQQVALALSPNEPKVSARLVTRVQPAAAGWEAMVVVDLMVEGGTLDSLRLDVPHEWSAPLSVSPSARIQTTTHAGQTHRRLTLWPDTPIGGKSQIVLRGPLRSASGELVRVSAVNLLDAPVSARFVQLPPSSAIGERWETTGLSAASLPADLVAGPLTEGTFETFAAAAPQFDAVLRTGGAKPDAPRVTLAEYDVAWRPAAPYQGRAEFHLCASSLASIDIDFPAGCRPASATLDALPVELAPRGGRRWTMRLTPSRLPLRVAVVFIGSICPRGTDIAVGAPTIAGLPAEATNWTLRMPPGQVAADLRADDELVRLDQELARLKSASQVLETAARADLERIPSDALVPWVFRLRLEAAEAAQQARKLLRSIVDEDGARQKRLLALEVALDEQLDKFDSGKEELPPMVPPGDQEPAPELRTWVGAVSGQQARAAVRAAADPAPQEAWRFGLAGTILAVGLVLVPLACLPAVRDWAAASAPFLVAAAGVALALYSPLGLAGLVLPALALWHSSRRLWAQQRPGRASSIVNMRTSGSTGGGSISRH